MLTKTIKRLRQTDWRIFLGILITAVWIGAGVLYLRGSELGRATIYQIPLENIGSFLEGAFAPLAFLWLVIGLFIQQKELADNTEVLRQQSLHAAEQTKAMAATEFNARQEAYFKIAQNVKGQLGGISGMLFISSMGASEGHIVSAEKLSEMWHNLAMGDDQVFSREFLLLTSADFGGYEALFFKTDIRRRHSQNFIRTFDRLMQMARNCDDNSGIIADSLAQTAHGLLYNRMRDLLPADMKGQCRPVDSSDYEDVLGQQAAETTKPSANQD